MPAYLVSYIFIEAENVHIFLTREIFGSKYKEIWNQLTLFDHRLL